MNEARLDQNREELLTYEISDEMLELAGGAEMQNANTFYSVDLYCDVFLPWSLTTSTLL
jgi:hypothetical protein